jgi:hypothetical protein
MLMIMIAQLLSLLLLFIIASPLNAAESSEDKRISTNISTNNNTSTTSLTSNGQTSLLSPRTFVLDSSLLAHAKQQMMVIKDNSNASNILQSSLKQLLVQANLFMTKKATSVVEKTQIPSSGNKHENIFLEAFNQGLIMHEMGGFDVQKAREVFNIPEDFEAGIMIAIGYQDIHQVLPESLRQKAHLPRERKPISEFAFLEELDNGII